MLFLVAGVMECVYTEQKAVVRLSLRRLYMTVRYDLFQMTDRTHKMKQTVLLPSLYTVQAEMSIFMTLLVTVLKVKVSWDVTLSREVSSSHT